MERTDSRDRNRGTDADSPADIPPRGWREVARRVGAEVRDDHSSLTAAGVAYYLFLAAVPALAATISVFGLVAGPDEVQGRVAELFGALPEDARALLDDQLSRIAERPASQLGLGLVVSVGLALWSASSGIAHLVEALNISYDEEERRGFLARRGLALGFTLAGILTFGGVAVLAGFVPQDAGWSGVARIGVWLVAVVALVVGLAALYRYGPDRDGAKWRWVTPGSVVAVVLVTVISIGLRIYAANFGSYDETYGSLAAVVLLLLWLYLTAFAVIVGAQLNSELEHQTERDSTKGPDRPLGARDAEMADRVAPPAP